MAADRERDVILLVEDTLADRELTLHELRKHGVANEIVVTTSGAEAATLRRLGLLTRLHTTAVSTAVVSSRESSFHAGSERSGPRTVRQPAYAPADSTTLRIAASQVRRPFVGQRTAVFSTLSETAVASWSHDPPAAPLWRTKFSLPSGADQ